MAQRHMCPSAGVLRRSLAADVPSLFTTSSRALSSSAIRLEEEPSNAAPSSPAAANPNTRRDRSNAALRQITSLQARRAQPSQSAQPSGPLIRRVLRGPLSEEPQAGGASPAGPRPARFAARPTNPDAPSAPGAGPPGGQMVRGPVRVNRNATVGGARGPNLAGRTRGGGGGARGGKKPGGSREQGPKKRARAAGDGDDTQATAYADIDASTTLSDGMVRHLLRLQRKEWDRTPYEPKYAPGSFAAQELIHEGRELFRGEAPPVKYWGKLEKRIGIVGMHGAEAVLKVRRVPDGDAAPFGQEPMDVLEAEAVDDGKNKIIDVEEMVEGKKEATVQ